MIYFVQCGKNGPIKIGYTGEDDDSREINFKNVNNRIKAMQVGCPYELKLLWAVCGGIDYEADLHEKWTHENIRGEWFRPSRKLLSFIENDVCNRYDFQIPDMELEVKETKNTVKVISKNWIFLIKKDEKKIGLEILDGSLLELSTDGDIGPLVVQNV